MSSSYKIFSIILAGLLTPKIIETIELIIYHYKYQRTIKNIIKKSINLSEKNKALIKLQTDSTFKFLNIFKNDFLRTVLYNPRSIPTSPIWLSYNGDEDLKVFEQKIDKDTKLIFIYLGRNTEGHHNIVHGGLLGSLCLYAFNSFDLNLDYGDRKPCVNINYLKMVKSNNYYILKINKLNNNDGLLSLNMFNLDNLNEMLLKSTFNLIL